MVLNDQAQLVWHLHVTELTKIPFIEYLIIDSSQRLQGLPVVDRRRLEGHHSGPLKLLVGGAEHLEQFIPEVRVVGLQVGEVAEVERNRDSWLQHHWDDGLPLQAVSEQRHVGLQETPAAPHKLWAENQQDLLALLDALGHVLQHGAAGSEVALMVADLQAAGLQLVDEGVGPLVVSAAVADEDMVTLTISQCGSNINRGRQWDSGL